MRSELSEQKLCSIRRTKWVGNEIHYYDVTDSTNLCIHRLAQEGAAHGTLVVADRQSEGRGRRGRNWSSPAHSGIFMSLLLRPDIGIENASMLTLVTALAVVRGIEAYTKGKTAIPCAGVKARIKWPNDIVINGKKVCGILTEMNAQKGAVEYIVIGVGINVHNREFPPEIAQTATSMDLETGVSMDRAQLLEAVWESFEHLYDQFMEHQDLRALVEEYNSCLVNRDQGVRVLDPKEPFEGVARGITERGELLVEAEGVMHKVSSGEVSVRGIYGYV